MKPEEIARAKKAIDRVECLEPLHPDNADLVARLARLGLWAEEHGIKLAESIEVNELPLVSDGYAAMVYQNRKAIDALPTRPPLSPESARDPGPASSET